MFETGPKPVDPCITRSIVEADVAVPSSPWGSLKVPSNFPDRVPEFPAELPLTSTPLFKVVAESTSLEQMKQGYSALGISFQTEDELIQRVRSDHQALREQAYLGMFDRPPGELIHPATVKFGTSTFRLFGIYHDWGGKAFEQAIYDTVKAEHGVLCESNLTTGYMPHLMALELKESRGLSFGNQAPAILIGLKEFALDQLFQIFRDEPSIIERNSGIPGLAAKIRSVAAERGIPLTARAIRELRVGHTLNIPADLSVLSPQVLEIELRERMGQRYTTSQQRSAYTAEFIRHLGELPFSAALMGAAHVSEVRRFLEHPINDSRVAARAKADVEILKNGGLDRYTKIVIDPSSRSEYVRDSLVTNSATVATGLAAAGLAATFALSIGSELLKEAALFGSLVGLVADWRGYGFKKLFSFLTASAHVK